MLNSLFIRRLFNIAKQIKPFPVYSLRKLVDICLFELQTFPAGLDASIPWSKTEAMAMIGKIEEI